MYNLIKGVLQKLFYVQLIFKATFFFPFPPFLLLLIRLFCSVVCEDESDGMGCLSDMFAVYCVQSFKLAMASLNKTDWCVWSKVNR